MTRSHIATVKVLIKGFVIPHLGDIFPILVFSLFSFHKCIVAQNQKNCKRGLSKPHSTKVRILTEGELQSLLPLYKSENSRQMLTFSCACAIIFNIKETF